MFWEIDEEDIKQAYHNNVVLEGIQMTYEEYRQIYIAVRTELNDEHSNLKD